MFETGLEYIRADFHLHTRRDKEFSYKGKENDFVKAYVSALKQANISIGVITNHNKFDKDEYNAINRQARKNDIFILPGVELTVKEGANGIHILIVFDPCSWLSNGENHIQSFLTSVFTNIPNPENSNTKCNYDLRGIMELLDGYDKDYFVIFAHVDQKSGLFCECQGGLLEALARLPSFRKHILGLQKSRSRENIAKFEQYFNFSPALVEGSDPKSIDDIGKGDRQTYLKVGEYSYSAVKFALQDHRNRTSDCLNEIKHGYIKSLYFKGGKLDGQKINFSPDLNTLIGIRGSGKSSLIETIRYILGLSAQADEAYKDDLVKNVLGAGGKVTLTVADKYGKDYTISRINDERINVLDSDGNDLNISPLSLFNGVQYFGQKDLSDSVDNENGLLGKFVNGKIENRPEIDYDAEDIISSIKQLLEIQKIPEQIENLKNSISEIEHKISIYEEKGVSEKLKKQTEYTKDKVKFEYIVKELSEIIKKYNVVYEEDKSVSDIVQAYHSEYNSDLVMEIETVLDSMDVQLNKIGDYINKLNEDYKHVNNIVDNFTERLEGLSDEFAEIKREVNDDILDIDGYTKLTEHLERSKEQLSQLEEDNETKSKIEKEFLEAIRNRNDMLLGTYNAYKNEVDKINQSQNEIKIEIAFKGDKESFKMQMKNDFKGTGISENKYQRLSEQFTDYIDLIEDWILNDGTILLDILSPSEYSKLDEKLHNQYEILVRYMVKNKVDIYYHGKLLKKSSIGQRASALILFILTQNDNDIIIIDQPEDDLDNKVIYDEVITTIIEKKQNVQFIFATHNANIPVLGDAERVIVSEFENEQGNIEVGNIDLDSTHKQIIDIMEGGQEAFNKRKVIYTNWE